jgi:hypothetical protein
MHCLSSVYVVITPLHVLGVSAAHHQEVDCIYVWQMIFIILLSWLSKGLARIEARPTDSQLSSTICPIYTFSLLMMGC